MPTNQSEHAKRIATQFKEIVLESNINLDDGHCQQLALMIEAALDTVLVEQLESMSTKLERMVHEMRKDEALVRS